MRYILLAILLNPFNALASEPTGAYLSMAEISSGKVALEVDADSAVNAVGIEIRFNPDQVTAAELDFSESFCELFIEMEVDQVRGLIKISCGKPTPGVTGKARIGTVDFKTNSTEGILLTFAEDCQVLANDGMGTNILAGTRPLLLLPIQEKNIEPEKPEPAEMKSPGYTRLDITDTSLLLAGLA